MKLVSQLPLLAFWLVTAFANHVGAVEPLKAKSYREWKSEKVQEAIGRVIITKTQIQVAKYKDPNLAMRKSSLEAKPAIDLSLLEEQLNEDQTTLEMAKDLSVTDYFVGYLTKLHDKKAAFNEVAGKLTAEEVAELMSAYANSVFGSHTSEMPASAANISVENSR